MLPSTNDVPNQFEYWAEELLDPTQPKVTTVSELYQSLTSRLNSLAIPTSQFSEAYICTLDQILLRLRHSKEVIISHSGSLNAFERQYPAETSVVHKHLETMAFALTDLQSPSNDHKRYSTEEIKLIFGMLESVANNLTELSESILTLLSVRAGCGPFARVKKYLKEPFQHKTEVYFAGDDPCLGPDPRPKEYQDDDKPKMLQVVLADAPSLRQSPLMLVKAAEQTYHASEEVESRESTTNNKTSVKEIKDQLPEETLQDTRTTKPLSMNTKDRSQKEIIALTSKSSSSDEFKRLKRLDQDNEKLRQEVVNLGIRNDENLNDFLKRHENWMVEREKLMTELETEKHQRKQELSNKQETDKQLIMECQNSRMLSEQLAEQEARILRLIEKLKADEAQLIRLDVISKERNHDLDQERKSKAALQEELNALRAQLEARKQGDF